MSDPTTSDDHGNPEHSLGLSSHGVTILAETFRQSDDEDEAIPEDSPAKKGRTHAMVVALSEW